MKPTLIKNFISNDLAQTLAALFFLCDDIPHYLYRQNKGNDRDDTARGDTLNKHSPLWGDATLLSMLREVQMASGNLNLTPTYAFARLYEDGAELLPHFDKVACEYTASVCLAHDINEPNPLFIEHDSNVKAFDLEPGDGVVYTGSDCRHWRDPVSGWALFLFLHYVNTNGDFRNLAYDERPGARVLFEGIDRRLSLGGGAAFG